jgi:mono/diheme cytochrome c family protein
MTKNLSLRLSVLVLALVIASCSQSAAPSPTTEPLPATAAPVVATVVPSSTAEPPTATAKPPTTAPNGSPVPESTSAATEDPTEAAPPTPRSTTAPTESPSLPSEPDPRLGEELWPGLVCSACHGQQAEGDIGPMLAGTGLSIEQVRATVRLGKGRMPALDEDSITDVELGHVYAWLRSMALPTPTPIARPSFPTQALSELWYYVNEMRIRADFAKDLPVRLAPDEAGRLQVVKDYSDDGLNQVQAVLSRAGQALVDAPNVGVMTIIQEIVSETSAVGDRFNRALAADTYEEAWAEVAAAVQICRLDTLPWATQAVRDAGLVGQARVRVVDQAGQPIAGAFVTALTAHSPLAGRTDHAGWATFVNVAAVPALPVKAYAEGRVYHEVNFNISPSSLVEGTIALPELPDRPVAPEVSGAFIIPPQGAGDATVTFALDATDPQGRLDLAEDQIFALQPNLGVAYVLLHTGGSHYEARVRLPGLTPGLYTWSFFAVDHECSTSNIIDVSYQVE